MRRALAFALSLLVPLVLISLLLQIDPLPSAAAPGDSAAAAPAKAAQPGAPVDYRPVAIAAAPELPPRRSFPPRLGWRLITPRLTDLLRLTGR